MAVPAGSSSAPRLAFGAVTTTLLENRRQASPATTRQLLDLVPGRNVSWTRHPLTRGVSPDVVEGVDCPLPTGRDGRARGVGTVVERAVLTGGHVLQGSAFARIRLGGPTRRMPWSHYSSQPGVIEILKRVPSEDLVAGWQDLRVDPDLLNLGAASQYLLGRVQRHPALERDATLKCQITRLDWAVEIDPGCRTLEMAVHERADGDKQIHLVTPSDDLADAVRFAEVFALHDWLYRALDRALERSQRAGVPTGELYAAQTTLWHLWNPGAHLSPAMRTLWEEYDRTRRFDWQWATLVQRIRDRLCLAAAWAEVSTELRPG